MPAPTGKANQRLLLNLGEPLGLMTLASFFSGVVSLVPMALTASTGARLRTDGARVVAPLRRFQPAVFNPKPRREEAPDLV